MKKNATVFVAGLLFSLTASAAQQITLEPGSSATLRVNEETIVQCRGSAQSKLAVCSLRNNGRAGVVDIYVNNHLLQQDVNFDVAAVFLSRLREIGQCQ